MQVEFPGATSAVRGRKKGRDSGGPAGWQVQVDGAGAPRGRGHKTHRSPLPRDGIFVVPPLPCGPETNVTSQLSYTCHNSVFFQRVFMERSCQGSALLVQQPRQ